MCTTIRIPYDEGSVLARNMDYESPVDYNILYFPKNYSYAEDLTGNTLSTKYRMLGLCFNDRDPLKDGINEHGLMGITNMFFVINPFSNKINKEKINLSSLDYMNYALTNYKNIDELIDGLDRIHIATHNHDGDRVICPEFHFMFVDRTNRSVVVEPSQKKLVYYENPYDTMTNSPAFLTHIRRMKKHFDETELSDFNSAKKLPGGYDPVSRFIKAYYLTKTHVKARESRNALENAYSILEAMKLPKGFIKSESYKDYSYTRYMCAYDNIERRLTVRHHNIPEIFSLTIGEIEHIDHRVSIDIPRRFTPTSLKSICEF